MNSSGSLAGSAELLTKERAVCPAYTLRDDDRLTVHDTAELLPVQFNQALRGSPRL